MLEQTAAAMRAIDDWQRANITAPDEIAMSQTTRDALVLEHFADLGNTIPPTADATLMGIPIFVDDTIPPGTVEVRVRLKPGMSLDNFRRLAAAGYRFPEPVFDPSTWEWSDILRHDPERTQ